MTPEQRVKITSDAISIYIEEAYKRNLSLPSTEAFSHSVQIALLNQEDFVQKSLSAAYEDYIKLLHERLSQLEPFAANHNQPCPLEMVTRGEACRIAIAKLKETFETTSTL